LEDPFSFLDVQGWRPGLERIEGMLEEWGNPQKGMKVVLVGGSNGKGSTTAMLSSILREAGFSVGSFYSPHMLDPAERIQVNGRNISEGTMELYANRVRGWVDSGKEISYFEALTASAYDYFQANGVDWAVMEVGMGGRLDATNVAEEELSVITSISLEHTRWLGDTLEKIAFEKAGIIKKGPCVSASGLAPIRERAAGRGVPLYVLGEDFWCAAKELGAERTVLDYDGKGRMDGVEIRMLGVHQMRNAALAIRAAEELGIGEERIRNGIAKARMRGRMEVLRRGPLVVADVAHNPEGAAALAEGIGIFGGRKRIVVFGCMKDKDWKAVLGKLAPVADKFIFVKADMERAEEPGKLLEEGRKYAESESAGSVREGMRKAVGDAGGSGMVLITGSLAIMGEAYSELGVL